MVMIVKNIYIYSVTLILFSQVYCPVNAQMNIAGVTAKQKTTALSIADFILNLQNDYGAIPDTPEVDTTNEDSNMEYALIGLGAAYKSSQNHKYLDGLEKGIEWLAGRQVMDSSFWHGSWYYAYSSVPPFTPVKIAMDENITDVRGVDTTCALFVYLLYLHSELTGNRDLFQQYKENAKAALDFLINNNRDDDGYFFSSWQEINGGDSSEWQLYKFKYSADQADLYLGFHAGSILFSDDSYTDIATFLKDNVCQAMFDYRNGRYFLGMDSSGNFESEKNSFAGIFSQGYLPFVFGRTPENSQSLAWLRLHTKSDGSLSCFSGDPKYSLTAALYLSSLYTLQEPVANNTINWLMNVPFDPLDGSIRDSSRSGTEKFANVAGFAVMSLLDFSFFEPPEPQDNTDLYLTEGMEFNIKVKELNESDDVTPIARRPIVYAEYSDPFNDGALKRVNMKVLTRISKKEYRFSFRVGASKNIPLYSKKQLKSVYKAGIPFKNFNGQISSLAVKVHVLHYLEGNRINTVLTRAFYINPPEINSVESVEGEKIDSLSPGDFAVLEGKYFGSRKPKIWIEYLMPNNRIKTIRCKVLRPFKYSNMKGKAAKSCMYTIDGTSRITFQIPVSLPSGMMPGTYSLLIQNRVGMDSIDIQIDNE